VTLSRVLLPTALTLAGAIMPAFAQVPPEPTEPSSAFAPGPSSSCVAEFTKLREVGATDQEIKRLVFFARYQRNALLASMCIAVDRFVGAEKAMVNYAEANAGPCGFSAQFIEQTKARYDRVQLAREHICAARPRPAPRLLHFSDMP
jgi:hypothetical protein